MRAFSFQLQYLFSDAGGTPQQDLQYRTAVYYRRMNTPYPSVQFIIPFGQALGIDPGIGSVVQWTPTTLADTLDWSSLSSTLYNAMVTAISRSWRGNGSVDLTVTCELLTRTEEGIYGATPYVAPPAVT